MSGEVGDARKRLAPEVPTLREKVGALAKEVDVYYPIKFQFGAEANYIAGYTDMRSRLRALLAEVEPQPVCKWKSHSRPEGNEPCECVERLAAVTQHVRTEHEEGPDYCHPCSDAIQEWVTWDDPKHQALVVEPQPEPEGERHDSYYSTPGGHDGKREDCKICPPLAAPVSSPVAAEEQCACVPDECLNAGGPGCAFGSAREPVASEEIEIHILIGGLGFVVDTPTVTAHSLRALPFPPVQDDKYDVWKIVHGGTDLLLTGEPIAVSEGDEFYFAPKFINAGAPEPVAAEERLTAVVSAPVSKGTLPVLSGFAPEPVAAAPDETVDLAEQLRDWSLGGCDHSTAFFDRCCSPCLRDHIIAAGYLSPAEVARVVAEAKAEAWDEAVRAVADVDPAAIHNPYRQERR